MIILITRTQSGRVFFTGAAVPQWAVAGRNRCTHRLVSWYIQLESTRKSLLDKVLLLWWKCAFQFEKLLYCRLPFWLQHDWPIRASTSRIVRFERKTVGQSGTSILSSLAVVRNKIYHLQLIKRRITLENTEFDYWFYQFSISFF